LSVLIHIIVILLVALGTFFSVAAVVGFIRLPDVYTRLHTTGKVSVFGAALLLVATAVWSPVTWGHALVMVFFLLATGPSTAHAVGSAAFRIGLRQNRTTRNDLEENNEEAARNE
jgi:multicomponent Na+:H+ antiporter subunit G